MATHPRTVKPTEQVMTTPTATRSTWARARAGALVLLVVGGGRSLNGSKVTTISCVVGKGGGLRVTGGRREITRDRGALVSTAPPCSRSRRPHGPQPPRARRVAKSDGR